MRVLTSKSPPPQASRRGHPLMPRSAQVDDMRLSTASCTRRAGHDRSWACPDLHRSAAVR